MQVKIFAWIVHARKFNPRKCFCTGSRFENKNFFARELYRLYGNITFILKTSILISLCIKFYEMNQVMNERWLHKMKQLYVVVKQSNECGMAVSNFEDTSLLSSKPSLFLQFHLSLMALASSEVIDMHDKCYHLKQTSQINISFIFRIVRHSTNTMNVLSRWWNTSDKFVFSWTISWKWC